MSTPPGNQSSKASDAFAAQRFKAPFDQSQSSPVENKDNGGSSSLDNSAFSPFGGLDGSTVIKIFSGSIGRNPSSTSQERPSLIPEQRDIVPPVFRGIPTLSSSQIAGHKASLPFSKMVNTISLSAEKNDNGQKNFRQAPTNPRAGKEESVSLIDEVSTIALSLQHLGIAPNSNVSPLLEQPQDKNTLLQTENHNTLKPVFQVRERLLSEYRESLARESKQSREQFEADRAKYLQREQFLENRILSLQEEKKRLHATYVSRLATKDEDMRQYKTKTEKTRVEAKASWKRLYEQTLQAMDELEKSQTEKVNAVRKSTISFVTSRLMDLFVTESCTDMQRMFIVFGGYFESVLNEIKEEPAEDEALKAPKMPKDVVTFPVVGIPSINKEVLNMKVRHKIRANINVDWQWFRNALIELGMAAKALHKRNLALRIDLLDSSHTPRNFDIESNQDHEKLTLLGKGLKAEKQSDAERVGYHNQVALLREQVVKLQRENKELADNHNSQWATQGAEIHKYQNAQRPCRS
jgi:hypothetical protein